MQLNTHIIEKIIYLAWKIEKFWENQVFKPNNITVLQFNILGVILADNAKTINDIKKKLIVSAPSVSQVLNRMEKKSLIKRVYGKWDRREVYIEITDKWVQTYNNVNKQYIELADKKMKKLSIEDKKKLLELLEKLEKLI